MKRRGDWRVEHDREATLLWELYRLLKLGMDPDWALRVLDAMPDLPSEA